MPLAMTSSTLYRAQRRRLRPKRWFARGIFLSQCLVSGVLGAVFIWGLDTLWSHMLQASYFRLQKMTITGTKTMSQAEVHYLLSLPDEMTLLQLDLARMGTRLLRHPVIKRVTLRRQLPDTLQVTIQERTPYVVVNSGDQRLVVDRHGVVLRTFMPEYDTPLPELKLPHQQVLVPGMHLRQDDVTRAIDIVRAFRLSPLADSAHLVSLTVQPTGASVCWIAPYPFTIHLGEGLIAPQLERLPLVLQYIMKQNLAVQSIDLSYRQRIIVTPAS